MKCPQCIDQTLVMTERQNVEIDYCPSCRGIWLDRGELDKLLERAAQQGSTTANSHVRERHPKHDDDDRYKTHHQQHRHSKSWLSDIFD